MNKKPIKEVSDEMFFLGKATRHHQLANKALKNGDYKELSWQIMQTAAALDSLNDVLSRGKEVGGAKFRIALVKRIQRLNNLVEKI